jgi:hypothetical protein
MNRDRHSRRFTLPPPASSSAKLFNIQLSTLDHFPHPARRSCSSSQVTSHEPPVTTHFSSFCFHALTNCPFSISFLLTFMQNAGGVGGTFLNSLPIPNRKPLTSVFATLPKNPPITEHPTRMRVLSGVPDSSARSRRISTHFRLSPLQCADPKNAPITRLECAVPKTQGLKSFRMRTYEKRWGRGANC